MTVSAQVPIPSSPCLPDAPGLTCPKDMLGQAPPSNGRSAPANILTTFLPPTLGKLSEVTYKVRLRTMNSSGTTRAGGPSARMTTPRMEKSGGWVVSEKCLEPRRPQIGGGIGGLVDDSLGTSANSVISLPPRRAWPDMPQGHARPGAPIERPLGTSKHPYHIFTTYPRQTQ